MNRCEVNCDLKQEYMKYLNLILIILVISSSCKKKSSETCSDGIKNQDEVEVDCGGICSPCSISYPENGAYGTNVLYGVDTLVLTELNSSLRANIPEGSSLKIELTLISGNPWFYSNEQNWTVTSFSNNKQTFTNLNAGTADLQLHRADTLVNDTIQVKYFENGSNETRRKIFIRE